MKIKSFSVSNYRSITRAHKIEMHDLTILVGKNNEGKSNIIKALSLSMKILSSYALLSKRHHIPSHMVSRLPVDYDYKWIRDFPVESQQKEKGKKSTKFELEFELTVEERKKFNKEVGTRLATSNFDVTIEIGDNDRAIIKVMKKGSSKIKDQSLKVCEFIAENLVFNYIPAIRTESQAIRLIEDTISSELKTVENNEEYRNAIATISKLQKEPLDKIASKVKKTLSEFIPSIEDVKIEIEENIRRYALRRDVGVFINDGVMTNIEYKGDGIKSLATLAMLTDRYNVEQSSIIAIDEPEAHLHPGSIRQLNTVLQGLVNNNQVIISTHNPLFINKSDISSNVIVSSGKATPAKNIKDIRDTLGVEISDNLISCNYIVFVEGLSDKKVIESLLCSDADIKKAIDNSLISVESLHGVNNLSSKLYESHNTMFDYYVFLDGDNAGRDAYEEAESKNLINISQISFTSRTGKRESELEDLIIPEIYLDRINSECSINIIKEDLNSMKKWSDQIEQLFIDKGKPWSKKVEDDVKTIVADEVCKNIKEGNEVLSKFGKECIETFIENIKKYISSK